MPPDAAAADDDDVILTRDIDIAVLSVYLAVRDVPVSDENGLTYRHSFSTIL